MKWQLFIGHFVFVGSVLLTALILLLFKSLRRVQRRRSPLHGKQIGHVPGQQLLERIEKSTDEITFGMDIMIIAMPILFLVWTTMRVDWTKVRFGINELIFLICWGLCFAYGFLHYKRNFARRELALDGLLAERVTGMQLNRLVAQGCIVLHDVPSDVGNIDHIVVAPQGVFAVETKSFRKPKGDGENHRVKFDGQTLHFPDFKNVEAIKQAERSAQWVSRFIRDKIGCEAQVIPALALPGWYIERAESAKSSPVRVFTPMGRGADFIAVASERLRPEQRALIAQALALQYPSAGD